MEVFCRLYDKGLIYRGNRIINWCPRCQTALSDEESEHQEKDGKIYFLKYPVKDSNRKITVATTRPETMLGDVAVAVNPRDERYKDLVGKMLELPLTGREIPVSADDDVDPEFGTGLVKITPAHDPNDFEMGLRHELTPINVMNDDGSMNELAGEYNGMDRFACRKKVIEDLESIGLLEKIEEHKNSVGHCYRCDTVVEPRLSPQWFVKMKPLAGPAIAAVRNGDIKFVPERWNKVYLEWMENIRDWCILVRFGGDIAFPFSTAILAKNSGLQKRFQLAVQRKTTDIRQDEDVLDTWFSSWLCTSSVFGFRIKLKIWRIFIQLNLWRLLQKFYFSGLLV